MDWPCKDFTKGSTREQSIEDTEQAPIRVLIPMKCPFKTFSAWHRKALKKTWHPSIRTPEDHLGLVASGGK